MTHKAGDILLVEDNDQDAEIAIRTLKKKGVANEVHWVKDGVEALDFIRATGKYQGRDPNNLPQVVLLDLRLPKMDGLEVLQAIRTDPRLKLLPVVVLTSSTEEEDIVRSYELGVNSYVSKPVTFEDFSHVVEQLGMYWLLINRRPQL
jgi:two-component system response regulator